MDTSPLSIITDEPNLLAAVRELYSRRPESRHLQPWELQSLLWLLGYTNDLAPEAEIAAAAAVARTDWDSDGVAA
jgi:hypothetical protein